jgi:uncharacterized membrane protein YkvA (DUF1232 family)
MAAIKARARLKNLLMFIPNMLLLCGRLLTDARVPKPEKALVAGAIIYAIVPLDLIPDLIPFVGQIDDAYLIAITLLRLIDRTDPKVVREHWNGGGDIVQLIEMMAMTTKKFLPSRIRRVLTSRVEVEPRAKKDAKRLPFPALVVKPEREQASREMKAN